MLFPTISLTSPYILFEGYVIEGSFICRGAPAGNRSVLYSLANSFEWQDAAPESILVSCRSCNWICCLHLLLFFLKKFWCKVRPKFGCAYVYCSPSTFQREVLWKYACWWCSWPDFLGRRGQFPQFSTVLALDKAGSDFPQPGNSVSKVSVFFVGQGTRESPEKARMFLSKIWSTSFAYIHFSKNSVAICRHLIHL